MPRFSHIAGRSSPRRDCVNPLSAPHPTPPVQEQDAVSAAVKRLEWKLLRLGAVADYTVFLHQGPRVHVCDIRINKLTQKVGDRCPRVC